MSTETQADISEDARQTIEHISDAYGTPEGKLLDRMTEYIADFDDMGVSDPERRALRKLALDEKGGAMGSVEDLRGMVLGAGDPADTAAKQVARTTQYIKKRGLEAAAKQGMVRKASQEVDGLSTIKVDGQPYFVLDTHSNSPTQGEVLPEQDWVRYIQGAVWRGEDGPYLFEGPLNAEDPTEVPPVPPLFVPVEFRATYREDEETGTVRLSFREGPDFEPVEDADIPAQKVLESLGVVPLAEVAEYSDRPDFDQNELVVTKGSVTYMDLSPDGDQSRRLTIVDPFDFDNDPRVTVWLPEHHEVNYGEQSDVYVLGNVSPSSSDEYDDSVNARGVWVDPDYRVERGAVGSLSADEAREEPGETADTPEVEEPEEADAPSSEKLSPDEQPDLLPDDPEPPAVGMIAEADYNELRAFAASYDDIPGSGIKADKLRKMLMSLRNRYDAGEFDRDDEPGVVHEADPDDPKTADVTEDEVEEPADEEVEAVEEYQGEQDGGVFSEPTDEDDDWSW